MDIFDKIISGEIPSQKVFENEYCIAILDISPVRKGHTLVISKESKAKIEDLTAETLSNMMLVSRTISKKMHTTLGASATNVLINNGKVAGQEVPHVHIHIVPRHENDGEFIISKKETYSEGEMQKYASLLSIKPEDVF